MTSLFLLFSVLRDRAFPSKCCTRHFRPKKILFNASAFVSRTASFVDWRISTKTKLIILSLCRSPRPVSSRIEKKSKERFSHHVALDQRRNWWQEEFALIRFDRINMLIEMVNDAIIVQSCLKIEGKMRGEKDGRGENLINIFQCWQMSNTDLQEWRRLEQNNDWKSFLADWSSQPESSGEKA